MYNMDGDYLEAQEVHAVGENLGAVVGSSAEDRLRKSSVIKLLTPGLIYHNLNRVS